MIDYKQLVAEHAASYIEPGQIVGVGAGRTILHLLDALHKNEELYRSLIFVTPCVKTYEQLQKYKMRTENPRDLHRIDWYFDGCDQVDAQLNAWKSGGGIHSGEKILASMASQFVILADDKKFVPELNNNYPICVEVIPGALSVILHQLKGLFPDADVSIRLDATQGRPRHTVGGNYLLDAKFKDLPLLPILDKVKMMPGVIDHSLFFQIATQAYVAGPGGIRTYHRAVDRTH